MNIKILFKIKYISKLLTIFFLLLLLNVCLFPQKALASGWLTGWNYRKQITISHTNVGSSDLTNFPLLVKINNDSDLVSALSNGQDIRFTEGDGTSLLSYERESWSGGNGNPVTA